MLCSRVQNKLSAYADYELSGAEMLAVRRHLGECPACACELAQLQQVKSLLGALPAVEAPAFDACRVAATPVRSRFDRLVNRWLASWTRPLTGWHQTASYVTVGSACGLALALLMFGPHSEEGMRARLPLELPAEPRLTPVPPAYYGVEPVTIERVERFPRRPTMAWPAPSGYDPGVSPEVNDR